MRGLAGFLRRRDAEVPERLPRSAALVVERAEVRVGLGQVAREALGLVVDLDRLVVLPGGEVGRAEEEIRPRVVAVGPERLLVVADRRVEVALRPVEIAEELQAPGRAWASSTDDRLVDRDRRLVVCRANGRRRRGRAWRASSSGSSLVISSSSAARSRDVALRRVDEDEDAPRRRGGRAGRR